MTLLRVVVTVCGVRDLYHKSAAQCLKLTPYQTMWNPSVGRLVGYAFYYYFLPQGAGEACAPGRQRRGSPKGGAVIFATQNIQKFSELY